MAELQLGKILSGTGEQVIVEAKNVQGTYTVWDTLANRDAHHKSTDETIINGSLCYVTETSKFYLFNGTQWNECKIISTPDGKSIQENASGQFEVKVLANGGLYTYNVDQVAGLAIKLATNSGLSLDNNGLTVDTNTIATKTSVDNLEDRVENLEARGRFLSLWNATTGLPSTYPVVPTGAEYPYTYSYVRGDYFIITDVPTTGTKYKPDGTGLTKQTASSDWTVGKTAETGTINVGDFYTYDGAAWTLLPNPGKTVTFANIAGSPFDNTQLATALNSKIEGVKIGDTTASLVNHVAEFEAEVAGALALLNEVSESVLDTSLAAKITSIANKQVGTKVNGNELSKDTDGKVNISLETELTFDTTTNKIKITRPGTANGQVLTAKSDGTIVWETVGTGDILFKDADKSSFATKAEFDTAAASGTFYLANGTQKASATITKGDYVIITADETHGGSQARYGYSAVAGSYASTNWVFEYTLGSAYTGENGVQINGTVISAKLDGTSLAASANGLKINDGWTSGSSMILDGGNASLTDPTV